MIRLEKYGPQVEIEPKERLAKIETIISEKNGAGNDFLGWLDYANKLSDNEVKRIIETAQYIRNNYDALVVVGIGGSYLGSRAVIDAINGLYPKESFPIYFLGNTLSSNYTHQVLEKIKDMHFAVNVISKSGTTTEPAVAFRLLKDMIIKKYGPEELSKAIIACTDKARGALKKEANEMNYVTFTIPDDVGGRYSVITPVGLLPIAVAGLDIKEFVAGFKKGEQEYSKPYENNTAYQYGATRYALYKKGYKIETYVSYEPHLSMLNEWLKQLYGESEGKEGKGLFPASIVCTTDLHSMGQFVQEGSKVLFETIVHIDNPKYDLEIPSAKDDLDGLNYLAGKKLSYVNEKAYLGTRAAHSETGNVPVNVLNIDKLDEKNLGELMYFFMRACAFSAYLLDINPFNQPGVEVYKSNMFKLLGKPTK